VKVEIGSGPRKGENGWLTVDMSFDSDFYWDLRRGLPFPRDSVSVLYSSHVLEHFSYRELNFLLSECLRVLKSGGEFSACVPDASIYLKGYSEPSKFDRSHLTYGPAVHSGLNIDIVNYVAYMNGEHKHMFDGESIIFLLREAGFQEVRLRAFDKSIDLHERIHESLYVTCRKKQLEML
jgi:predicted SAM-dependent methyltransferase